MRDGMRGALSATVAALRAYRRLARDAGASAAPGADGSAGGPSRSDVRRSLIVFGAVSVLAVAALVAAAIITFDLYGGGRSSRPRAVLEPYGTAPAATSTAVPVSGTVNGSAATSTGPLSAGATPKASAPVGAVVSTASASGVAVGAGAGAPTATASAAPVDTATATATPSLVDLCRSVVAAGNGWPSVLKSSDRSTVIAAAGTKKNVLPYCTALLAGTNTG